jgi:predicted nucleic acid-binding protein
VTLDTSAIYALVDRLDPDHARVKEIVLGDSGPFVVPALVLCEVGYLIERRLGVDVLTRLLRDIEVGSFSLDCGEEDLARVSQLVSRYRNLPLGLADAAVVACAERTGGVVATLDLRHFSVIAREGRVRIIPQ